jgi:transketolase
VNGVFELITKHPEIVVLDAEVSNSTHLELIQKNFPQHFYEMFIAEQNMVGVAAGLARRGKYPIVSTFAAFFTRAFDQIRMASQAELSMMYLGSYAGVSIGKDGPSQMGLEDLALFRSLWGSVVLYPADAYSAEKMAHLAFEHKGPTYIRTTREPTPSLYLDGEEFHIGGSKVVQKSDLDIVTLIGAGITVHEAIKAYDELKKIGITARVIDLYSIKPIDHQTLEQAINDTQALVVVEDHYPEGGIAEAIRSEVTVTKPFASLAVRKLPQSGTPAELLDYEEISAASIVATVRSLLQK